MDVSIHRRPAEVARFLDTVRKRADSEKHALGFLPTGAYEQAAVQGKLFVATAPAVDQECYAGHLLFGGAFPHFRVFQIYVVEEFRRMRVGLRLIRALVEEAENAGYLTISARVADDLPEANAFWSRAGFDVLRAEIGGSSRARVINIRVHTLKTPTLFSQADAAVSDLREVFLPDSVPPRHPVYSLDVNVLLDIVHRRAGAADARRIVTAAMSGLLRLFVSEEFLRELERSAPQGADDRALEFARTLPQFPAVPRSTVDPLITELGVLLFPNRARVGALRPRDRSDILHLATAIHHSATGFVTNETGVLKRRALLRAKYGIELLGSAELAEVFVPSQWDRQVEIEAWSPKRTEIEVAQIGEDDRKSVEQFLSDNGLADPFISEALHAGPSAFPRRRVQVVSDRAVVGFASWDPAHGVTASTDAFVVVDPSHPLTAAVCDYLLDLIARDASSQRPAVVVLRGDLRNYVLRGSAVARGFTSCRSGVIGEAEALVKVTIGKVVAPLQWSEIRAVLAPVSDVLLPPDPPLYQGISTQLSFATRTGRLIPVPLAQAANRFGPALFVLPGRPFAVVPIRGRYSAELLNISDQKSLLPRCEALLRTERVYYSSPRGSGPLSVGTIVLFYESRAQKGRGALVACARVVGRALKLTSDVSKELQSRGVLQPHEIADVGRTGKVSVTYFDNIFLFRKPITLRRLRAMGCGDPTNFVTARPIPTEKAIAVLTEGQPHVSM
jgi:GNAT superfamily N-acetyltransferase/predicted nucleic acid-binding protein